MTAPRTRADLDAAFALLERVADRTYDEQPTEQTPLPAEPHPSRGRQRLLTVAAAAAVVALAGGVAALTRSTDHPAAPAGRSDAPPITSTASTAPTAAPTTTREAVDPRVLPFALHLPAADQLGMTARQPDGSAAATIVTPSGPVNLVVDPPTGVDRRVATTQAEPVDVDGHQGWYGADIGLTYTVPDPTNSPGANPPSSGTPSGALSGASSGPSAAPSDPGQRAVAWQYDGHAWAVLMIDTPILDRDQLLALARGIDFGATTAITTPLGLHDLPQGVQVTSIASTVRGEDGTPTYDATIDLRWAGHRDEITLQVALAVSPPRGATPAGVEVAGHPAVSAPGYGRQVFADLGHGAHFVATAVLPTDGSSLTVEQFDAIVRAVTLVDRPDRPDTWLDARTALP
ncbi:MAG: hypothetical protein ACTHMS_19390 [Jatrophihabitans sp.]|uniref:hypothetical protein n=1 Tax=Jatrophihabitans sp. TaxID=1932789 RepID=UPI003F80126F